jgi:hypothetical protein
MKIIPFLKSVYIQSYILTDALFKNTRVNLTRITGMYEACLFLVRWIFQGINVNVLNLTQEAGTLVVLKILICFLTALQIR